jgi:hypothetical protein
MTKRERLNIIKGLRFKGDDKSWLDILELAKKKKTVLDKDDLKDAVTIGILHRENKIVNGMLLEDAEPKVINYNIEDFSYWQLFDIIQLYNKYIKENNLLSDTVVVLDAYRQRKDVLQNMVGAIFGEQLRLNKRAQSSFEKYVEREELNLKYDDLTLKNKVVASRLFKYARRNKLINYENEYDSEGIVKTIWGVVLNKRSSSFSFDQFEDTFRTALRDRGIVPDDFVFDAPDDLVEEDDYDFDTGLSGAAFG